MNRRSLFRKLSGLVALAALAPAVKAEASTLRGYVPDPHTLSISKTWAQANAQAVAYFEKVAESGAFADTTAQSIAIVQERLSQTERNWDIPAARRATSVTHRDFIADGSRWWEVERAHE